MMKNKDKLQLVLILVLLTALGYLTFKYLVLVDEGAKAKDEGCEKHITSFLLTFDEEMEADLVVEGQEIKQIDSELEGFMKFEVDGKFILLPKGTDYQITDEVKTSCK